MRAWSARHLRPSERGRRPHPAGLVRRARSRGSTMSRATSRRSPSGSPASAPGPISPTAPTGSPSPTTMAERTRAVEERLSDALHERLTQRFVDRRTAVLMRELGRKGAGEFPVTIDDRGRGQRRHAMRSAGSGLPLRGRSRRAPCRPQDAARRGRAAARPANMRSAPRRWSPTSDEHFTLRTEPGRPVAILWRGHEVARLGPGKNLLSPAAPCSTGARPRLRSAAARR